MRPRLRQALALAAGAGLALLSAEAALTVLELPRERPAFVQEMFDDADFVSDPDLFWRLAPDSEIYAANPVGTRGPWPRGPKGPRDYRLLCIGDSCTFGAGVRLDETWGHRLRHGLARRLPGTNVDVALAANPGWSTYQNRVLVERTVQDLAPDLTVLYCGAWNDYVPAVGEPDAARHARWRPRTWRLVATLVPRPAIDRDEYVAAFRRGEAPDGRRVPLADFESNVEAMVRAARTAGSRVLAVLPPLPASTRAEYPIALGYRDRLARVLRRLDVASVDGTWLFEAFESECPDDWRSATHPSPCHADWVHPSALGHAVLAEALLPLAAGRPSPKRRAATDPTASAAGTSARPGFDLRARAGSELDVPWDGGRESLAPRAWLGRRWLPLRRRTERRITLAVPRDVPPGTYTLSLSTPDGPRSIAEVAVEPLPLEVTLAAAGDGFVLRAEGRTPPGWRGLLWLASERREHDALTRYGPFALAATPDGRPPGRADLPFLFERLQLPAFPLAADATGRWQLHEPLPTAPGVALPARVFVQAALRDPEHPWRGAVTAPHTLPLAR